MARRRRNTGFRLDIIEAGDLELAREVVPLLVVARHQLAAERHPLLQPATQPADERSALILLLPEEVEQLALTIEIGKRLTADQLHQFVAEQCAIHPVLEIFFASREIVRILGRDALQPSQNVARDEHGIQRVRPDVRVAVDVDVALGARQVDGNVEQRQALVGRDISGPTLGNLRIVRLVEQRRHPELEVQSRRHEQVGLCQGRHEARLGLHVVRILVTHGDRADFPPIAHDLHCDRGVRRERGDHLDRRRRCVWS